jgi:hypothetical protein
LSKPFKQSLAKTYLGRLASWDPFLCLLVLLFFVVSITSNLIKLETSPFFVWSVYSAKASADSTYSLIEVRYNNNKLLNYPHTWQESQKMMLFDPLSYYIQTCIEGDGRDRLGAYLENHWGQKHPAFRPIIPDLYNNAKKLEAFPDWYKSYLSAQTGEKIDSIFILKQTVRYTGTGHLELLRTDSLLTIR